MHLGRVGESDLPSARIPHGDNNIISLLRALLSTKKKNVSKRKAQKSGKDLRLGYYCILSTDFERTN